MDDPELDPDDPLCIRCRRAPAMPLRTRCPDCQTAVELERFAQRNADAIDAIAGKVVVNAS